MLGNVNIAYDSFRDKIYAVKYEKVFGDITTITPYINIAEEAEITEHILNVVALYLMDSGRNCAMTDCGILSLNMTKKGEIIY